MHRRMSGHLTTQPQGRYVRVGRMRWYHAQNTLNSNGNDKKSKHVSTYTPVANHGQLQTTTERNTCTQHSTAQHSTNKVHRSPHRIGSVWRVRFCLCVAVCWYG